MELRSMTSPRRCISPRHRRPPECQLRIGVNTVETVGVGDGVYDGAHDSTKAEPFVWKIVVGWARVVHIRTSTS